MRSHGLWGGTRFLHYIDWNLNLDILLKRSMIIIFSPTPPAIVIQFIRGPDKENLKRPRIPNQVNDITN